MTQDPVEVSTKIADEFVRLMSLDAPALVGQLAEGARDRIAFGVLLGVAAERHGIDRALQIMRDTLPEWRWPIPTATP